MNGDSPASLMPLAGFLFFVYVIVTAIGVAGDHWWGKVMMALGVVAFVALLGYAIFAPAIAFFQNGAPW